MKPIEITKTTWSKLVDEVHKVDKKTPLYACLAHRYNVCLNSLVTPLSYRLFHLYEICNGTSNESFESIKKTPAIYVLACKIIDMEINRIDKQRQQSQPTIIKDVTLRGR